MQHKTVTNKDVAISYITVNEQTEGTPLVIIPGMVNAAEEVQEYFSPFFTYPHIIISLRGRGGSDSPEQGYTLADQASDVLAVIEAEQLQDFCVFGHSIGSSIGIYAVHTMPQRVKAFIMGDFPPYYPPYGAAWAERVLTNQPTTMTEKAVRGLAREAEKLILVKELQLLCSASRVLVLQADEEASYAAIKNDDADKFAQHFPLAQLYKLKGIGHEMLYDNPQEIAAIISRFIKGEE